MNIGDFVRVLNDMLAKKETYAVLKFGFKYWEELGSLPSADRKEIISDAGLKKSMNVELKKGIELGKFNSR